MDKTIQQKRSRQKKLILFLVVLLIGVAVFLYFGLGLGLDSSSIMTNTFDTSDRGPLSSSVSDEEIISVSLDLSILEEPSFLGLQVFGELPIILGEFGRSNPFISTTFSVGE